MRRARPITAWYGAVMVRASLEAWHARTILVSKGKWQKPQGTPRCACCPQVSQRRWSSSPTATFSCVFVSPSSSCRTRRACARRIPQAPWCPLTPNRCSHYRRFGPSWTSGRRKSQAEVIPVTLHAQLSDIGTLGFRGVAKPAGERQWRLQFDVRAAGTRVAETPRTAGVATGEDVLDKLTLDACGRLIHETFASTKPGAEPEGLTDAWNMATEMPRTAWPSSVLRRFWEAQWPWVAGRQFSPAHEARWLNLAGLPLRPGYGMAVDDWRVAQTWRVLQGRLQHPRNEMCRAEWWILWRRIAGGLEPGQQQTLAEPLMAALRARWSALAAQQSGRRQARASKDER